MQTSSKPRTWAEIEPGHIIKYPLRRARKAIGAPGGVGYSPAVEAGYIIILVDRSYRYGRGWMVAGHGVVGEGFSNTGEHRFSEVYFGREYQEFEVLDESHPEAVAAYRAAREARGPLASAI